MGPSAPPHPHLINHPLPLQRPTPPRAASAPARRLWSLDRFGARCAPCRRPSAQLPEYTAHRAAMTAEEMKAAESGAQSAPLPLEGVDISPKQDEGVLKVRAGVGGLGAPQTGRGGNGRWGGGERACSWQRLHRPPGPGCVAGARRAASRSAWGGPGAPGRAPNPERCGARGRAGTTAPTPACAVRREGRGRGAREPQPGRAVCAHRSPRPRAARPAASLPAALGKSQGAPVGGAAGARVPLLVKH